MGRRIRLAGNRVQQPLPNARCCRTHRSCVNRCIADGRRSNAGCNEICAMHASARRAGFPDPVDGGFHINNTTPGSDLDDSSPQFVTAYSACKALSPEGRAAGGTVDPQLQAKALAYAACIRSHGVPSYPDPVFVGGSIRETSRVGSGADPSSPLFVAAQHACQSLQPFGSDGSTGSSGP